VLGFRQIATVAKHKPEVLLKERRTAMELNEKRESEKTTLLALQADDLVATMWQP
jgi:hypothetical protein